MEGAGGCSVRGWDCVAVTVGNESQKLMCERFAPLYREKYGCELLFVSDGEADSRIGSGGAVLNVLEAVSSQVQGHDVSRLKLLIINSGGMSKRAVNYAVRGKVLANVCTDENGDALSLLDVIIVRASELLPRFDCGTVVCCSDIPVDFSSADCGFDLNVGFCVPVDIQTGSRHGVMFSDSDGLVEKYLHKRSAAELEKVCRSYDMGKQVLADTGAAYFCPEFVSELFTLQIDGASVLEKIKSEMLELSLYSDIFCLLDGNADKEKYLFGESGTLLEIKTELFNRLSHFSMRVCALSGEAFTHFGTVSEAIDNIKLFSLNGGQTNAGFYSFNSFVDLPSQIGRDSVLDNARIDSGCKIGNGCLVTDVSLKDIEVPDKTSVCGVKLCDGSYVAMAFGIDENPKEKSESGSCLWDEPRFYRGFSFTDSYNRYASGDASEDMVSMGYCVEHADHSCLFEWQNYLKDMISYGGLDCSEYYACRQRIIEGFMSKREMPDFLQCKTESVRIELPVRVNFSGTWTDAMPYCTDNGGRVVNAAITVNGEKPVCVTAQRLREAVIELCSEDTSIRVNTAEISRLKLIDEFDSFNLHRAVLSVMGILSGGRIDGGFRLTANVSGIMKGSGLGTSSILLAGCFRAMGELLGLNYSDDDVVNMVFVAEQVMKTGGGWQDQTGGLSCGIKEAYAQAGFPPKVVVKQLNVPDSFKEKLSERLLLVSTQQRHYGRFIVNDVMRRYISGNSETLEAFSELLRLNNAVVNSIETASIESFAECINRQWSALKRLSPKITNERIDRIVEICMSVSDAVCVCGAGAGGYLLVLLKHESTAEGLKRLLDRTYGEEKNEVKKPEILF